MVMFQHPDLEDHTEQPGAWQLTLGEPGDGALMEQAVAMAPDVFDETSQRLSTECVCRRLREWVKRDLYEPFPEYLDKRGHGFEVIVAVNLLRSGHRFYREAKVPWSQGESGIDFVVVEGPMVDEAGGPFVRELKANKEAELRSENRRQLQRQRRCVERASAITVVEHDTGVVTDLAPVLHAMPDERWGVWVLDPRTWRIPLPGGYAVPLDDDRRAEVDAELALTDEYTAKIGDLDVEWEYLWPTCTCGGCWDKPIEQLPSELEGVVETYLEASAEAKFASDQKALLMKQIREVIHTKAKALGMDPEDRVWEGVNVKVTVATNGTMTPRKKKVKRI